ncbi:hypothetical protein D3C86_1948920 [compost metagenome]
MRGVSCDENPPIAESLCGPLSIQPGQKLGQIFELDLLSDYLLDGLIHARLVDFVWFGDQHNAELINTVIGQQGH